MFKYTTLILFCFYINHTNSQSNTNVSVKDTIFIMFKNDKKFQLYDSDLNSLNNIKNKKTSFYFSFSDRFDYFNAILFAMTKPEKFICIKKNVFRKKKDKILNYLDFKKMGYKEIDSMFYMKKVFLVDKREAGLFTIKLHEVNLIDLRKPSVE